MEKDIDPWKKQAQNTVYNSIIEYNLYSCIS